MRTAAKPRRGDRRSNSASAAKRHLSGTEALQAERNVLRALCQSAARSDVLARSITLLAHYRFREPAHQIVFDALRELGHRSGRQIRELLAVRLNNKGFPDLNLEPFFEPSPVSPAHVFSLIRALQDCS